MKKALFLLAVVLGLSAKSFAGNPYKLNQSSVNDAFAQATEVSFNEYNVLNSNNLNLNLATLEEPTKSGFLIRAFFCGNFALHRSYMGTKGLFIKYFCTFGVISCVDFWGTVIKGDEFFNKFKGNDKFVVWGGDKK